MPTKSEYVLLSQAEQEILLDSLARAIAPEFGLEEAKASLLAHSFNTSFKFFTPDDSWVMRINTNSSKDASGVLAEVQWLEALQGSDIRVPSPLRTTSGEAFSTVLMPGSDWELFVTVNSWLKGELPGDEPTSEQLFQMGVNIAKLHEFAGTWRPKAPASLPRLDSPLLEEPIRFGSSSSLVDIATKELLFGALAECEHVFDALRHRFPLIPIHSDVHTFNVMWDGEELAIFDFDDSGMGLEVQDLPNCIYYLRGREGLEEHVLAGYSSVRTLPEISEYEFESLLLSRQLVLLNSLFGMTTAEEIEFIPTYLDWTKKRIEHFNSSGKFAAIK